MGAVATSYLQVEGRKVGAVESGKTSMSLVAFGSKWPLAARSIIAGVEGKICVLVVVCACGSSGCAGGF